LAPTRQRLRPRQVIALAAFANVAFLFVILRDRRDASAAYGVFWRVGVVGGSVVSSS
jgi:hypothetical protein